MKNFKSRKDINRLKRAWYYGHGDGLEDAKGFEDYRAELEHFRKWKEAGGYDLGLHAYAADYNLLDNLAVAEKLRDLEKRLDHIQNSYFDEEYE